MAFILKLDQDSVVGKLVRVWVWADQNSVTGNGITVTSAFIDRLTSKKGFAAAMREVNWLIGADGDLTFPCFDRHNGDTAKSRAQTNRRVASHRGKECNADTVTNVTPEALGKPLPEKRREENTPLPPKGGGAKPKGPLQLRAEALMGRKPDTPLTAPEARAFASSRAAIEATTEDDWLALESFYLAPQSETYARKALAQLVNNWNGEIDRAKAWRSGKAGSPTKNEPNLRFA